MGVTYSYYLNRTLHLAKHVVPIFGAPYASKNFVIKGSPTEDLFIECFLGFSFSCLALAIFDTLM